MATAASVVAPGLAHARRVQPGAVRGDGALHMLALDPLLARAGVAAGVPRRGCDKCDGGSEQHEHDDESEAEDGGLLASDDEGGGQRPGSESRGEVARDRDCLPDGDSVDHCANVSLELLLVLSGPTFTL